MYNFFLHDFSLYVPNIYRNLGISLQKKTSVSFMLDKVSAKILLLKLIA